MSQENEAIVRYTRLRGELGPVAIYQVDASAPINPDWVAITQTAVPSEGRINQSLGANPLSTVIRLCWGQSLNSKP